MTDKDKLDHLGALVSLFMITAEKGGTPVLTRVQAIVTDDLNELLTEIEEEKGKDDVS